MAKVRTLLDLEDKITAETAWRKQELALIRSNVALSAGVAQSVAVRSAIALLYAHWEGWIKNVGILYIRFVNTQGHRLDDLSAPFLGNALKTRIDGISESRRARGHTEFASLVVSGLHGRAALSESLIDTGSNLKSELMLDILDRLGLSADFFEMRQNMIDEELLKRRNSVAHGQYEVLEKNDYLNLHENVASLLAQFTTLVLNAASSKAYLSS